MATPVWRAGFEVEVVLGDLGLDRFADDRDDAMDTASAAFCRAVARALTHGTGRRWLAPRGEPSKPGFYVIPEHDLDPLFWPRGRVAGVELLTPPLPLDEAEAVRRDIIESIFAIDEDLSIDTAAFTEGCGWHINIDAGEDLGLSPSSFVVGADELFLLAREDRLFSKFTGLQRHAVGVPLLRHLSRDSKGALLDSTALNNFLDEAAGSDKRYAANFAKLERGYVELRHFSTLSFFNGPNLGVLLERIPSAFEMPFSQQGALENIFIRKFLMLNDWLQRMRDRVTWNVGPMRVPSAFGEVFLDGVPVGRLVVNGTADLILYGKREYDEIAAIRGFVIADVPEALALLALDLAELRNLGIRGKASRYKGLQQAILRLSARLRANGEMASDFQLALLEEKRSERKREAESLLTTSRMAHHHD